MFPTLALWYFIGCLSIKAPPPTPEQVQLVDRLGHPDWRTRERATAELGRMGDAARGAWERGLRHPDAEVRRRSHQLQVRHFSVPVDDWPPIYAAYDLEVVLPSSGKTLVINPGLPAYYYRAALGKLNPDWLEPDEKDESMVRATGWFAIHMRRAGMPKQDVVAVIEAMKEKMGEPTNNLWTFTDRDFYFPVPWSVGAIRE